MIYFKLPFDERLHTVEKQPIETSDFYSYNSLHKISFNGNIIKFDPEKFKDVSISNEILTKDRTDFTAETKKNIAIP
jgi:isochorismate synthase